jgi:hypothetical protein
MLYQTLKMKPIQIKALLVVYEKTGYMLIK